MDNLKLGDKKYLDDAGLKVLIEKIAGVNKEIGEKIVGLENANKAQDGKIDKNEKSITRIDQSAFIDVKCAQDTVNNKVVLTFLPKDPKDGEEPKTATIDTSAFVLDGMLGDVKLVVVSTKEELVPGAGPGAYEITGYNTDGTIYKKLYDLGDLANEHKINGERFLVFKFNITDHDGNLKEGIEAHQTIWINVRDLHDSYNFEAKNGIADVEVLVNGETKTVARDITKYFKLSADEARIVKGESIVTYTLTPTADFIKNMDLVDGTMGRGVAAIDAALESVEKLAGKLAQYAALRPITEKSIEDYFDWAITGEGGKGPKIEATDPETGKVVTEP